VAPPAAPAGAPDVPRPTLGDLETLHQQALDEGFTAGYQEGRKEGKEQGYSKGYERGHEAGFKQGYEEGIAAAQAEIVQRVQSLDAILGFMSRPLDELDATVVQELALLSTAIARQLVRRELKTSPGEIVAVVREAVALLPAVAPEVRIQLHPEDAELVRKVLALDQDNPRWRVLDDPTLSRGGCRVETEHSRIDATVEKRLGAAIAAVLGDHRQGERGRPDN
jgi:flagellar assembly protein FliH